MPGRQKRNRRRRARNGRDIYEHFRSMPSYSWEADSQAPTAFEVEIRVSGAQATTPDKVLPVPNQVCTVSRKSPLRTEMPYRIVNRLVRRRTARLLLLQLGVPLPIQCFALLRRLQHLHLTEQLFPKVTPSQHRLFLVTRSRIQHQSAQSRVRRSTTLLKRGRH